MVTVSWLRNASLRRRRRYDLQHYLPPRMARFALLVRLCRVGEREDLGRNGFEMAVGDEFRDLSELLAAGVNENAGDADLVLLREIGGRTADDGDEDAVLLQAREGA